MKPKTIKFKLGIFGFAAICTTSALLGIAVAEALEYAVSPPVRNDASVCRNQYDAKARTEPAL